MDHQDSQNSPYEYDEPAQNKPSRLKGATIAATAFLIFGGLIGGGAFAMTQAGQPDPTASASAAAIDPSAALVDPGTTPAPTDVASATPSSTQVSVPPVAFGGSEDDGEDEGDDDGGKSDHHGKSEHKDSGSSQDESEDESEDSSDD